MFPLCEPNKFSSYGMIFNCFYFPFQRLDLRSASGMHQHVDNHSVHANVSRQEALRLEALQLHHGRKMVWKQKKEIPNIFSRFFTLILPLQLDSCLHSHESSPPQLLCAAKMSVCAHCEHNAASEPYFKSWICNGLYVI